MDSLYPDPDFRVQRVICGDRRCQTVLHVSSLETSVECFYCGQIHRKSSLSDIEDIPDHEQKNVIGFYVKEMLIRQALPKRGTEMVKVLGLTNYYCKLLSPLLTKFGMDKTTGKAKLLIDMNQGDIFDCSLFGDRSFLIEPQHIDIPGFGRDVTGSMNYLSETLNLIRSSNNGEERLLPIHADGDGHCLVHAISRALVGRELFWHPLRCCLKRHFEMNLDKFKELFKDFIDTDEWQSIIDECDPDFKPPEGELHGLRNIHIFGLANVLKRPIILLDSLECMQRSGDYSALFLPGFIESDKCTGKDNTLNNPICIAWSSYSHNHYIPLVGVQGKPLPILPKSLIPKVWGMPQSEIMSYIVFDDSGNCTIGSSRGLSESYIQRLVNAMEGQFYELHGLNPTIVAETKLFFFTDNLLNTASVLTVMYKARSLLDEHRLYRCNDCTSLFEPHIDPSWLRRGGILFNTLLQVHKKFKPGHSYSVPMYGMTCKFDFLREALIPEWHTISCDKCPKCPSSDVYKVKHSGLHFQPALSNAIIHPVAKKEEEVEDTVPKMLTLRIDDNGMSKEDVIPDFQLVSNMELVDAVSRISTNFILKHFPEQVQNSDFHIHVCEEIYKKIGKFPPDPDPPTPTKSQEEDKMDIIKEIQDTAASILNQINSTMGRPGFVKVVCQNDKQANLQLSSEGLTYAELQQWVENEFSIPPQNQSIKTGFPPKELDVIPNEKLSLKHGDRLMVENCPRAEQRPPRNTPYMRTASRDSAFQNEVMWSLAKMSPGIFCKGGQVYEDISAKHILCDMVHVFYDKYPNKTFSYNASSKCIELCVKPLGHFEITMDLDARIKQVQDGETVNGYRKCPVMSLKGTQQSCSSSHSNKQSTKKNIPSSTLPTSLLRKGPGFSILSSPDSERMDIS